MAAIAMEEVLPSSVADAEALAPEELYKKKRGREAEFLEGTLCWLAAEASSIVVVRSSCFSYSHVLASVPSGDSHERWFRAEVARQTIVGHDHRTAFCGPIGLLLLLKVLA